MNYKETCEYLYGQMPMFEKQGASGYKEGLVNTLKLDDHFNHPHQNYRTIHVAGTNGKGSCAHTLAAILQMCGYKVGLYTSPHLVDFSERIRINGQPIDEDYVVDFVEKEKGFFEPLSPSFFEVVTAMAFKYFADKKVDFAVIEVGLGGRLDCTNIIFPVLSVITNIGLDHTQFLGNSLEQIAMEKAGIIKQGVPVVIGETTPETKMVFEAVAAEAKAPITFAEADKEVTACDATEKGLLYQTRDYGIIEGELAGNYQEKNTNTVLCAIRQLEKQGYMYPVICEPEQTCQNREVRIAFKNVCEPDWTEGTLAEGEGRTLDHLRHRPQRSRMGMVEPTVAECSLQAHAHHLRHGRRQGHRGRDGPPAERGYLLFYKIKQQAVCLRERPVSLCAEFRHQRQGFSRCKFGLRGCYKCCRRKGLCVHWR